LNAALYQLHSDLLEVEMKCVCMILQTEKLLTEKKHKEISVSLNRFRVTMQQSVEMFG
jgi:hypothetical protein